MRRKTSDRNKSKSTPEKSPEKSNRRSHRHSRRKRKSSSSSSEDEKPLKKNDVKTSEIKVPDSKIEPSKESTEVLKTDVESDVSGGSSKKINKKNETGDVKTSVPEQTPSNEEKPEEWKEDKEFWNSSGESKVEATDNNVKEKDGGSMWKVQSANGAGGEIQKLKICRQRPIESIESGDSGKKRSSRPSDGGTSSRSTDESIHEDGDKDTKKSKHRTRTSSRNSPSLSESSKVVCDVSEESPTKIKIINVSNLVLDKKSTDESENITDIPTPVDSSGNTESEQVEDKQQIQHNVLSADIPLPSDDRITVQSKIEPIQRQENDTLPVLDEIQNTEPKIELSLEECPETNDKAYITLDLSEIPEPPDEPVKQTKPEDEEKIKENDSEISEEKSTKTNISERKKHDSDSGTRSSRSSSRSSSDSDSDKSKEQKLLRQRTKVKLKRRSIQLSSGSQQHKESSESEEEFKKEVKEETDNKVNQEENEANRSPETGEGGEGTSEQTKVRKRRWGASKSIRPTKKPLLSISTNSLKDLVPGAKPVSTEELQLSVEEEEGQLDDDDEEDEVTILTMPEEKVEERPKEHEKGEKKKESRRERERNEEERKKRNEKREKIKPEQPSVHEKGGGQRKILLLTDDARKLARSPSPPRRRPSSVLFITNLVRPFTVQQLKNLLLRTGTIAENGFWIDSIKSKCYVEYTTEDAAVETRHALHGVRWPVSNPKTLIVEFSTHDDMAVAQALAEETEPIPRKAEPLILDRSVEGWLNDQARLKGQGDRPARRVMAAVREWDVGKPEHPDEIIEQDLRLKERQREQERRVRKERSHRSVSLDASEPPARKPRRKEEDAPAKLLDDLFRKTKSSPCIYWLPLTPEQIAVKEEMRRQHMAEHERRVAELKKADQARRDRERRNRK